MLNKKEEGELSFAARIKDPKSGRIMEVLQPNRDSRYIQIMVLMDIKGNMEQLSHVVVLSVLKHNTFLIVLIALTSLLLFWSHVGNISKKLSINSV